MIRTLERVSTDPACSREERRRVSKHLESLAASESWHVRRAAAEALKKLKSAESAKNPE
jgi:uncharacterized protein (DUF2336 family)